MTGPFVQLDDVVSVNPAEVRLVAGSGDTARVYLRTVGPPRWLEVNRPLSDVVRLLAGNTVPPATTTPQGAAS